jgi:hypothetical protein
MVWINIVININIALVLTLKLISSIYTLILRTEFFIKLKLEVLGSSDFVATPLPNKRMLVR